MFSIKNEGVRKVITILGIKFKFKSKKLVKRQEEKKKNEKFDKILKSVQSQNKSIKKLQEQVSQSSILISQQQEQISQAAVKLSQQEQKLEQQIIGQNKIYNQIKIKNENKILSFRTIQNLSDLIRDKISILPDDIDLVVGIPRSGVIPAFLIALFLNKKACTLNEFVNKLEPLNGYTRPVRENEIKGEKQKILIVDDSIYSGKSLNDAKNLIETHINLDEYDIEYCAIFALEQSKDKVNYYFEVVPAPRMFQWNYLNHSNAKVSCFDMDGVLCVDPTDEQNDDGEKYIDFILNAKPLYIPSFKINSIVTSRLEKYRPQTEQWLYEHNVQYENLYMLDLPTAEERRKLNCHADFKAKIYSEKGDCNYFIESNRSQAEKIAQITGKQVICVTTDEYFCN